MRTTQRAQLAQTIAAQSTARGMGAIGIVRMSGAEAFAIAATLGCSPPLQPYRLTRVLLRDGAGTPLDDAMAVAMPGPKSYTGEDLVELHVHGGTAVVEAVLQACLAAGARAAQPGEFTLRAYTHGRMDLAQAEAVGALIHAQTEGGRARALSALQGHVSSALQPCIERLEGVAAAWLSQLDFPDDTTTGASHSPGFTQAEQNLCQKTLQQLQALLGRMAQDDDQPPHVVLMGAVNTGKSTLSNALCGYERAIVDEEAGTTRDVIEIPLRFKNQRLQLWDTAGLREGAQGAEARGIVLGAQRAQHAAVVLWLCDGLTPVWPPAALRQGPAVVLVWGARADTLDEPARQKLQQAAQAQGLHLCGYVSGKTGEGLQNLQEAVAERLLPQGNADAASAVPELEASATLGNVRHRQQLQAAIEALSDLTGGMAQGIPLDLLLTDLQLGVRALGEILGRDVDAQVIDRIFSDFCIGK